MSKHFRKHFRFGLWCAAFALLASQATAAGVPAFLVTTPGGVASVLLGTMHAPAAGMTQPADQVLQGVRHFVVEQAGAPEIGRRFGEPATATVMVDGQRRAGWAANLSHDQLATLLMRAQCHATAPVDPEAMRRVLDFMLTRRSAMLLQSTAIAYCGPPGLKSRDLLMQDAAAAAGLAPEPLESATAVATQRDLVPEAYWRYSLGIAVSAEGPATLQTVVAAFNRGDLDVLRNLFLAAPADVGAVEHWDAMVEQRNRAWMPRLRQLIDDGPSFVLVGGAHLAGPGGLPARLKQAGYRVERVELPARP